MKRMLFLICFLIGTLGCSSPKVVKKSQKPTPGWLYALDENHIIVSGKGLDQDEAKQNAIGKVKEEIISAIAVNVTYNANLNTTEETKGEVSEFLEKYESSTEITSDYFESIKGISFTNVKEFYWEEIKEDGQRKVVYHLKYPFKTELNQLISEYERINHKLQMELNAITSKKGYETVEAILEDFDQLTFLAKKLSNKKRVEALAKMDQLENQILDLQITPIKKDSGNLTYHLTTYGKPIKTEAIPSIYPSCRIKILKVKDYLDRTEILYELGECDPNKKNEMQIEYDFNGYYVDRTFGLSFFQ